MAFHGKNEPKKKMNVNVNKLNIMNMTQTFNHVVNVSFEAESQDITECFISVYIFFLNCPKDFIKSILLIYGHFVKYVVIILYLLRSQVIIAQALFFTFFYSYIKFKQLFLPLNNFAFAVTSPSPLLNNPSSSTHNHFS